MAARSTKKADAAVLNRKALRDYAVIERFEAGVELRGSEVKSIRNGKIDLAGGYARLEDGDLFLRDVHISPYEEANQFNHEPTRRRRLLLHAHEIRSITDRANQRGLAIIPLRVYFKRGWAKIEMGLCKGKKSGDKRDLIRQREADREVRRAVSSRRGG